MKIHISVYLPIYINYAKITTQPVVFPSYKKRNNIVLHRAWNLQFEIDDLMRKIWRHC